MAYDREQLYEDAKLFIKENNAVFVYEVYDYLGIDPSTYYDIFKKESEESKYLNTLLRRNKSVTKSRIRKKLEEGKGVELLGLYKLLSNEDELRALNGQYMDHTSKGEKITITPLQFNNSAKSEDD